MKRAAPQCAECQNFEPEDGWSCPAFPGEPIPQKILTNEHDHREPFPGDHGIRFDPIGGQDERD